MTTFFFVRHGKTDQTGNRITGYLPNVHLNEVGRIQAERVVASLEKFPIEAIYSSPLDRAVETAAPLAGRLHLSVEPLDFLKEINFGQLQGLGPELAALDVWQEFLRHPAGVSFPEGESVVEAQTRIVNGLEQLARRFDEETQIVCVAHCEILRLAVNHVSKAPLDEYMRMTIDPGSISRLEWTANHKIAKFLNLVPA